MSITRAVALKMETVHASETLTYFYETIRRHIPEGCLLHTRRSEKLKSHLLLYDLFKDTDLSAD
jgi:hypothetical protein